ncbi:hypothetical protein ACFRMN_19260 [Streptomyces sp. NPDC056835]|uniref:hypothetical protein n=1 Tax=Streptomyces sp. NPDC056835 TaxID=3345956 RepID=UPI00369C32E4
MTSLLEPEGGWYGVFRHRDPDGLRACFDGIELPPWDVVESLLQDFAAGREDRVVAAETERAGRLYTASAAAHDRRPGGSEALSDRLRLMVREQARAAGRAEELVRLLATAPERSPRAEQLAHDLAWVRDDHARASARCAELRARLASLAPQARAARPGRPPAPEGWFRAEEPSVFDRPGAERSGGAPGELPGARPAETSAEMSAETSGRMSAESSDATSTSVRGTEFPHGPDRGRPGREPAPEDPVSAAPEEAPEPDEKKKRMPAPRRKPRGARFAGLEVDDLDEAAPAPALPVPPLSAPTSPRGARFGAAPVEPAAPRYSAEDLRAAAEMVATLIRLRADGRTGEAHVVLCEAAGRPPEQLPLLAAELHRAGLGADWAELLWEAAFLPPARLAAAAGALAAAGRDGDCGQLLRQGVSRPVEEISDAVLALGEAGRGHEARALLSAFVQARTPEDAVLIAAPDPRRLVPQLIDAARAVSVARERDLVHALRVAGIVAT